MKTILFLIAGAAISIGIFGFAWSASTQVKHVVVFKYKAGATPDQIEQVTAAFKALKSKIPGMVSFEYGVNNSPENKNKGLTHAYIMTFADAAARDAYLPHPEHKNFGTLLGKLGVVEDVFVVDFDVAEVK